MSTFNTLTLNIRNRITQNDFYDIYDDIRVTFEISHFSSSLISHYHVMLTIKGRMDCNNKPWRDKTTLMVRAPSENSYQPRHRRLV